MKSVAWQRRERKTRIRLIRDLIAMGMLECKPISTQQHTRPLTAARVHRQALQEHETQTMATEHARER